MFAGVTREICEQAWEMVRPGFERGVELGLLNGMRGGLVILDPADPQGEPLFTAGIGDGAEEFIDNALHKARLSAREQIDTSRLRQDYPHRYRPGDIKWPGGLYRHGLALGFSGVQGEYDEMVCEWVVAAIRAISRIQFQEADAAPGRLLG
ncbi:MAG: hypothetical protein DIU73_007840 [Actinomycetes bacterium]